MEIHARAETPTSPRLCDRVCYRSIREWRRFSALCYSEGFSKSRLTRLVGAGDGLASEWHYTLKTLPKGIGRGFVDFITRRDPGGLERVLVILAGFAATASGYLIAKAAGVFLLR